jgi:hypothetical protein
MRREPDGHAAIRARVTGALDALLAGHRQTFVCAVCAQPETFDGEGAAAGKRAALAGWRRVEGSDKLVCPPCMARPGAQSSKARRAAASYNRKRVRRGLPA